MRVLLVHPFIPARFNGAPMGLLYLAAELLKRGHRVEILDLQALQTNEPFAFTLRSQGPDIVGISSTSPSHAAAISIAKLAKSISIDTIVVKGGVHETYCAKHTLANVPEVDYSLSGECDYSFPNLVAALESGADLSKIPGLTYRDDSGTPISTNSGGGNIDLNAVPKLPRELLSDASYYDFRIFKGSRTAQV